MAYGEITKTFTFASAASKASEVMEVRGYQFASIQVPAFSTAFGTTAVGVKLEGGFTSTTGQLATVRAMGVYSSGSGILEWEVPESTGNYVTGLVPIDGLTHIRPIANTACTDSIGSFVVRAYNDR